MPIVKDDQIVGTVRLAYPISKERLINLLISAVEGGSNYWASFKNPRKIVDNKVVDSPSDYDQVWLTEHEPHRDDRPAESRLITAELLLVGLQRLADWKDEEHSHKFPGAHRHLVNFIEENDDAETADVVLQMTVFGELIYG